MAEILTSTGITFSLVTDTPYSTLNALDLGYVELSTGEQVINSSLNTTSVATYDKMYLGEKFHNGINSYVCFNPTGSEDIIFDIFDKGNTTIFEDTIRDRLDYDSTNRITRSTFDIRILSYDILNAYYKDDFKQRTFEGIKASYCDRDNAFMLSSYATKKIGNDLETVLNHIKYMCADEYLYNNGELITINGIPQEV